MSSMSRRDFLASAAATSLLGVGPALLMPGRAVFAAPAPAATTIRVGTRVIDVNGRPATVFGLTQPDGTHGLITEVGGRFRVRLENALDEATLIHWHGLTPPWQQDGVPGLSQAPLPQGASFDYDFALERAGTNWMHSHHGLQEQRLMAAPLIVRDPAEAGADIQEVVVLLHDFTFRDPNEILAELQRGAHGDAGHSASTDAAAPPHRAEAPRSRAADRQGAAEHGTMDHGAMDQGAMKHGAMDQGAMKHGAMPHGGSEAAAVHLHDVAYDAFLANDRTLDDPQVFHVERGGRVRLRLINGATATAFWIELGRLEGRLIAVDGTAVVPLAGRRFEFAVGQRLDIVVDLPPGEGAWPIFAVREGERARTGFVLATPAASITKIANETETPVEPVGVGLERRLRALRPLEQRPADRRYTITSTEAPGYVWMLNGAVHGEHVPLTVRRGERVEITFDDRTSMAHPMHLHGHHFQVVAINGERIAGAVRDTVLVPAQGKVTIAFDAQNPGKWALHCHHLYHMAAGMMTTMEYEG